MLAKAGSKSYLASAFHIVFSLILASAAAQESPLDQASESIKKTKPASDDIFTQHLVCKFQIELGREALRQLKAQPRKPVRATVRAMGDVYNDVSMHLKGRASFRQIDDKPNLTLDFAAFIPEQNFRGLRKFHLNNSAEDSAYLNELIGSDLFRAAGIPAPRVGHALVQLNGRALGLYVLKESFDRYFLGQYFARNDGALFEPEDRSLSNPPLKKKLDASNANNSDDFAPLSVAVATADPQHRWQILQKEIDMDRFTAFMAMEIMTCHWDGYSLGRNNFRIYHDPTCGKYVFLPAGMDQLFGNPQLTWSPQMSGPIAKLALETHEGRKEYSKTFRTLFETLFRSADLTNRIDRVLLGLRPLLNAGKFRAIRSEADFLAREIVAREKFLREQLKRGGSAPLVLDTKKSLDSNWRSVDPPKSGIADIVLTTDTKEALHILAHSPVSSSWRTTTILPRGHYRFEGCAKVFGVVPLPFGQHQGATLRVAGWSATGARVTASSDWQWLRAEFEVRDSSAEVELICEFRASSGEVWFDKSSLTLIRVQ